MIFHDIKFGSKMLRGNALQAATTVTGPQSAGGFDPRNICCFEMTWWFILIGGWQRGCHKKISRPPCLDSSTHYTRNFVPREAIPQAPESFLFPDSSSGQRSFWPILVEIWWVWFLGDTVPVDLGTTLPKTHFQEQARKRELRPPKQEAGTSMSRILIFW